MAPDPDVLAETNADWRGTPFRAGALAVWVVDNNRAVEGEIISWDRDYVNVRPARTSGRVVGGVPRAGTHHPGRPMNVDRGKVTVIDPLDLVKQLWLAGRYRDIVLELAPPSFMQNPADHPEFMATFPTTINGQPT
jgi:hypothetical protein